MSESDIEKRSQLEVWAREPAQHYFDVLARPCSYRLNIAQRDCLFRQAAEDFIIKRILDSSTFRVVMIGLVSNELIYKEPWEKRVNYLMVCPHDKKCYFDEESRESLNFLPNNVF